MPIPEQRDLERARDILAAWLAAQLPDARIFACRGLSMLTSTN